MKQILIAAPASGSGKTAVTCALLCALFRRGLHPEAFKCGPDYIDPMFHRSVLKTPSHNLDLFLQGREGVLRTLRGSGGGIAVLEAAMGYYDGVSGTARASAWELAELTGTPAILVLSPSGAGITLAAQVKGLLDFRTPSRIAGVILNRCRESLFAYLKPILERECGIPVLGYLPLLPEAELASRHLGLITADEVPDLEGRIGLLADALEEHCDVDKLLSLASESAPQAAAGRKSSCCTVAVARDAAFCFYYEENLRLLEAAGAELRFFRPLSDAALPACDGLYLGGGYPELYAKELSENRSMRASIRAAIENGLPTVAECGGFLYLQQSLDEFPMAGVLPGRGFRTERLQRFGYLTLESAEDSLLFRAGERIPAHEFHYWDCTDNGTALGASKESGAGWRCGFCSETLYAAFPHLHFGGELPLAERFVQVAKKYKERL